MFHCFCDIIFVKSSLKCRRPLTVENESIGMIKEEFNMALAFNDSNFQDEVLNSEIPVLVDFYADWCGPCKMMSPVVDELSREYEGRLKVGKVNVDENTNVAQQYRVMSIPTILLIKNGQVVDQVVGAVPKAQLTGKIDSIV